MTFLFQICCTRFFSFSSLEEIPFRCAGRNTTLRMVVDFFFLAASFFTSRWSKSIKPYSSPSKLGNSPGMWSPLSILPAGGVTLPWKLPFSCTRGLRGSFVVDSRALFLPAKESDAKLWGKLESVKKSKLSRRKFPHKTEPKLCICPVFARPHCRKTVPDCTTRHLGALGRALGSDIFLVHHQGNVNRYYFSLSSAARTEHTLLLLSSFSFLFGRRAPPSRG